MPLSPDERKRIEYLQQKLDIFRLQLEKLEKYLAGSKVEAGNAKIRLETLVPYFEGAMKYSEELRTLQPKNPQLDVFEAAESRYYEMASAVAKLQRPELSMMNATLNSSSMIITERQDLPRLPKIRIPTFDGKRENWANYKNKFIALVHSRSDISDAVKCSQLFDSLSGHALAKVSQFDPSDTDYPKAWQTLLGFYDHKRIVAVEHLNAILDLPQITKVSADDLSALLDKARQNIHILDGLGATSRDDIIVRIIERCLPPSVRSKWQDRLDMDALPKLEDLLKFIQTAIFKQQAFDSTSTSQRSGGQKRKLGDHPAQPPSKAAKAKTYSLVTSAAPGQSKSSGLSTACPKCQQAHRLFKCPIFNGLKVQERWNFVRSIHACQNCLWVHQYPCKSEQHCKKCSRKHHTLLHNDRDGGQANSQDATSSAFDTNQA